jgi:hypothetical protein
MGIQYVRFMAENPEHMKYLFLTSQEYNVKIINGHYKFQKIALFLSFITLRKNI